MAAAHVFAMDGARLLEAQGDGKDGTRLLEAQGDGEDDGKPRREGTTASSILSLVVSACGAGVLSLPYALRCTGWAAGSATLLVLALASAWSLELIEMRARDLRASSLEEIGRALWGPRVGLLVELLLFALLAAGQVTFLVLLGDLLPALCASAASPAAPPVACSRHGAIGASLCLAALPSLLSRLHALRHVSLGALACLAALLAVICAQLLRAAQSGELGVSAQGRAVRALHPPDSRAWLAAFPIQTAAFCNQFTFVQVVAELREPTAVRLRAVRLASVCACAAVCAAYGLAGYALFGEGVPGDLLSAFDAREEALAARAGARGARSGLDVTLGRALLAGKGALACCLVLKVPLLLQPMRAIALGWARRASRRCGSAARGKPGGELAERPDQLAQRRLSALPAAAHCASTAGLLGGLYCCAASMRRVEDVFAIAGALGLSVVCFVVPGSFAFRPPGSSARPASERQRAQGAALVALGTALSCASLYGCAADLIAEAGGRD